MPEGLLWFILILFTTAVFFACGCGVWCYRRRYGGDAGGGGSARRIFRSLSMRAGGRRKPEAVAIINEYSCKPAADSYMSAIRAPAAVPAAAPVAAAGPRRGSGDNRGVPRRGSADALAAGRRGSGDGRQGDGRKRNLIGDGMRSSASPGVVSEGRLQSHHI